jgi:hypothetical protein
MLFAPGSLSSPAVSKKRDRKADGGWRITAFTTAAALFTCSSSQSERSELQDDGQWSGRCRPRLFVFDHCLALQVGKIAICFGADASSLSRKSARQRAEMPTDYACWQPGDSVSLLLATSFPKINSTGSRTGSTILLGRLWFLGVFAVSGLRTLVVTGPDFR